MHNNIALSVDAVCPVVLVLLNLTTAFDTVDHTVLLSRLNDIGILICPIEAANNLRVISDSILKFNKQINSGEDKFFSAMSSVQSKTLS